MMKLLLNISVVLLTLFACYAENIYLALRPPRAQQTAMLTIRARRPFSFDQARALDKARIAARTRYVPIFDYRPASVAAARAKMQGLIKALTTHQRTDKSGILQLQHSLQEALGVQVSLNALRRLVRYRDLDNLLDGILTIEDSILQNKVVEDARYLKDKKSVEIHSTHPAGIIRESSKNLITVEKARIALQRKVRQLFWQVDNGVLEPVLQLSAATVRPNLEYNRNENNRRLQKIEQRYPSRVIHYRTGDILVPFHKTMAKEDVQLLTAYQQQALKNGIYNEAAWIFFSVFLMMVFFNLLLSKTAPAGSAQKLLSGDIAMSVLIVSILLFKGCLLFTALPIYVLPFGLLPLMMIALNQGRITAAAATVVGALLTSFISAPIFKTALFFGFGGLAAVVAGSGMQQRKHILIPSLFIGLVNVAVILAFYADWPTVTALAEQSLDSGIFSLNQAFRPSLTARMGWALLGGLSAGPLTLLLLPLLEFGCQTASSFNLNQYSDLQRPMLKQLSKQAPGTYQHAMTVAHLAHAAGEAIGANTLLLRIGAYYHDIGKTASPQYFIENQFSAQNPHDFLNPHESAELIIAHVKHGTKLALESRLPKMIIDLILQHHGTQLMEYFYNQAARDKSTAALQEKDFRYPGPKPQSIEAAILMVADAVEAASRALKNPTRNNFDKMVRLIIVKRIADGQFSEIDLTTRDLSRMTRALVNCLEASFHSRIRYPWQEKAKARTPAWRVGKVNEKQRDDRAFRL